MNHTPEPPGHVVDRLFVRETADILSKPSLRWRTTCMALNAIFYVVCLGVLAVLIGWAADRTPPVTLGARAVLTPQVKPGSPLLIRAEREVLRICDPDHRWSLVDGAGRRYEFDPEPGYNPTGPAADARGPVVPLEASPGPAKFISTLRWYCNPVHRAFEWPIMVVQRPDHFEIARP